MPFLAAAGRSQVLPNVGNPYSVIGLQIMAKFVILVIRWKFT